MQGLMALMAGFFLLSNAFDSLLRWLFELAHVGALFYVRDVVLVLAIALCYVEVITSRRSVLAPLAMLALLVAGGVVGLLSNLPLVQVLFGIKVWLPLLLGYLLANNGVLQLMDKPRLWFGLWCVLVLGVVVNAFVSFPWSGLLVEVADVTVVANREWASGGIRRLSGFSRSSFDAAIFVLLLGFYLVVSQRSILLRCLLWLVSGVVIVLTTTKGVVGTFLLATMLLPLVLSIRSDAQWTLRRALAIGAVSTIALIGLLAPLLASQIPFPALPVGSAEHYLFSSFIARAWGTWPASLGLLDSWQYLLGRGIGGIGVAQSYFELQRYGSADNFFLYCYVTAGALGACIYVNLAALTWRLPLDSRDGRLCFCVLLFVFTYGITVNIVESSVALGIVGAAIPHLLRGRPKHERKQVVVNTSVVDIYDRTALQG